MNQKAKTKYLINVITVVALFFVFFILAQTKSINRYNGTILIMVCINIILATSLNLTTGCLGQIALGHAGFMSVGAYTSAIISKNLHLGEGMEYVVLALALLVGGLIAAIFGVIIGLPALRLKGDYLAIITLGFGEIIRVIIENISITGGSQGLRKIPRLTTLPLALGICIVCVTLLLTLMKSRHGRAILSIREDDIAALSSGIYTTYYKTLAFTIAAFFAGIAGGLYAHSQGNLEAGFFNFNKSIEILIIVVLGGLGSFTGAIVAAIFLTILPELLRSFEAYRMLVYALALIIIMIVKPSGIFGRYEFSLSRVIFKGINHFKSPKNPTSKPTNSNPSSSKKEVK